MNGFENRSLTTSMCRDKVNMKPGSSKSSQSLFKTNLVFRKCSPVPLSLSRSPSRMDGRTDGRFERYRTENASTAKTHNKAISFLALKRKLKMYLLSTK
jgi:hypothetical protein